SLFEQVNVHFGGLNPDAGNGTSETVEKVAFSPHGDNVEASFRGSSGDKTTVEFFHRDTSNNRNNLADSDNDTIESVEANQIHENEYFTSDAGDFTHLWEVTGVERDSKASNMASSDQATIDLSDAVTGRSVTVTLNARDSEDSDGDLTDGTPTDENYYSGTEIIDGQTYHFALEGDNDGSGSNDFDSDSNTDFKATWGTDSAHASSGSSISVTTGGEGGNSGVTTSYPAVETSNGARLAFYTSNQSVNGGDVGASLAQFNTEEQFANASSTQTVEGANGYGNGDDIYNDDDSDDLYTNASDILMGGTTSNLAAGDSLGFTADSDWQGSMTDSVAVYDSSNGGKWDPSSDAIWNETTSAPSGADERWFSNNDTLIAGTAPADGTNETGDGGKDSDWTTVQLHDNSDGGNWDPSNDAIINESYNGTTYSTSADTTLLDGGDITPVGGDKLFTFDSETQHDGSGSFSSSNNIYIDNDADDRFSSGDDEFGSTTHTVRFFTTDRDIVNNLASGAYSTFNSEKKPSIFLIEEEDNRTTQEAYEVSGSWDSGNTEANVDQPSFSTSGWRSTSSLDSDTSVTVGYDLFGTYSWYDSDNQGSVKLFYPAGQATAGVAVTDQDGSISTSAGGTGTAEVQTPAGWPDAAMLDSDISGDPSTNTILVGGPVVNSLVQDLADMNKTQEGSEYSQGSAIIELIDNAWNDNDALVVAGYSGSDTREAANALADMDMEADTIAGNDVSGKA
ncbi:MAG: S-layer protein, partial [Candidatus Nanohaloarchaea archaeon]|nr:S-layer protein [Candidatus Nanohaloarchaea archaeon]